MSGKDKFELACERAIEHIKKEKPNVHIFAEKEAREARAKQVVELGVLQRSKVLPRMEAIIRDGRLKFLKPKVTRTDMRDSFEHNGLYITPQVQIVSGAELLNVEARWHMQHVRPNTNQWHLPHLFHNNGLQTGLSFTSETIDDILAHVVLDDVTGRLQEMVDGLEEHWKTIESKSSEIETEYRGRRSDRDRKEFRKKMVKALRQCKDLVDEDPAFILKVMQLDFHELETLSKFAKRNPADMPIIDVEDVKLSLDELRVAGVMDS